MQRTSMRSGRTTWRVLAVVVASIIALLGLNVQPASAVQHSAGRIDTYWTLHGGPGWNIDQQVLIGTTKPATYYSLTVGFQNSDWPGAYMGLQTLPDGSGLAIFSMWNSPGVAGKPTNGMCVPFGGEGDGLSCRVPFQWRTDRWYTFRIWEVSRGYGSIGWGAWIIDKATGQETYLGALAGPTFAGGIVSAASFSEYWGERVDCRRVPYTRAFFLAPVLNQSGRYASHGGTVNGKCSGGYWNLGYGGVQHQMGYYRR